ncbi:MAG: cytochrome c maturation protein CcmE [Alphaproteobacteria bacterium]
MRPKHRNRRIGMIAFFGGLLAVGAVMLFSALKQNTQYFYNPSQILAADFAPKSPEIRVGGLVLPGSLATGTGLTSTFHLGDFPEDGEIAPVKSGYVTITYTGILPDLFREGQGVVITGTMDSVDAMTASDVLAKHDENYQPKI